MKLHLSRAWKPKRLNTKTKASDYGCISLVCVETKPTENGEPPFGAASRVRVGTSCRKATTQSRLQEFNLDYLFSLFSNAEVIVRAKIYKP